MAGGCRVSNASTVLSMGTYGPQSHEAMVYVPFSTSVVSRRRETNETSMISGFPERGIKLFRL